MRFIVVALLIASCTSPTKSVMPSGNAVGAPGGWIDYCKRNPGDPSC